MPPDELARIERFIAAYNSIDDFLQRHVESPQTFRSAVDYFARRHPWWRDAETLRVYAALRNFLVHEKTQPFEYPCVPSEAATRDIEAIRDRLLAPARLGDAFKRRVLTLKPEEPLRRALEVIAERGYSRFPVYDGRRFVGLLTENGIALALADKVAAGKSLDVDVPVSEILPRETRRRNFRFAEAGVPVSQAAFWFHDNTFLEAVLITEDGREDGELLGIVTRGDMTGV